MNLRQSLAHLNETLEQLHRTKDNLASFRYSLIGIPPSPPSGIVGSVTSEPQNIQDQLDWKCGLFPDIISDINAIIADLHKAIDEDKPNAISR